MKKSYVIGVDIGGTNTDGVLIDANGKILSSIKKCTTSPVDMGFSSAVQFLIQSASVDPRYISRVAIGSTHAINALLTQQDLYRVGLIRIARRPSSLPAAFDWPAELRKTIVGKVVNISGGFECDGRESAAVNLSHVRDAVAALVESGAESIAVSGAFSPLYWGQEEQVGKLCRELCELPVTLSHVLGGIGFVERENAALINALLIKSVKNGFDKLQKGARALGINCPIYLTQNNGTLLSIEEALEFPIKTIASGPSNSCVGAARLTGLSDAVVVDIGGTSTDVGIVIDGFVRRTSANTVIGGVALNFPMPDVISIAIGGGSIISNGVQVGPSTVGCRTLKESQSVGGSTPTLTDVAVVLGTADIEGCRPELVKLSQHQCVMIRDQVRERVSRLIEQIKGPRTKLPVVVVGGGANLALLKDVIAPKYADVANALGAALAEVSATLDVVVSLDNREQVIAEIEENLINKTHDRGACPSTIRIVYRDILPYHYVPGHMARVVMTAAGKLAA